VYFLDTDSLNLLLRGHESLSQRAKTVPDKVFLSSITLEEIVGGQLYQINTQRSKPTVGIGYASKFFVRVLTQLSAFSMIAYPDSAEAVFRQYPASLRRVGPMDCRLAAHASTLGFTIVTCNTSDFSRIPDAKIEDWSQP